MNLVEMRLIRLINADIAQRAWLSLLEEMAAGTIPSTPELAAHIKKYNQLKDRFIRHSLELNRKR